MSRTPQTTSRARQAPTSRSPLTSGPTPPLRKRQLPPVTPSAAKKPTPDITARAISAAAGAADYDDTEALAIFKEKPAAGGENAGAEARQTDDINAAVGSFAVEGAATVIGANAGGSRAVDKGGKATALRAANRCCVSNTSNAVF